MQSGTLTARSRVTVLINHTRRVHADRRISSLTYGASCNGEVWFPFPALHFCYCLVYLWRESVAFGTTMKSATSSETVCAAALCQTEWNSGCCCCRGWRMCTSDNAETIWLLSNNELAIVWYGYMVYSACVSACVCVLLPYCGPCGALLQVPEKRVVIGQWNHTLSVPHRLPQHAGKIHKNHKVTVN